MSEGVALSMDERYARAMGTRAVERRARPRHLLWLGGLVLVAGIATLAYAWVGVSGARGEYDRKSSELGELNALVSQVLAIETEAAQSGGPETAQLRNSRVRELATRAGLEDEPPIAQPRFDPYPDARRVRHEFTVRDVSMGTLLSWVELVLGEYEGSWVHEISVKPLRDKWELKVEFAQWEPLQ